MPYIPKDQRPPIDVLVDELERAIDSPGKLNYAVTRLILHKYAQETRYHQIAALIGTLECIKLEFYRVQAAGYEDDARGVNGPVIDLVQGGEDEQAPLEPCVMGRSGGRAIWCKGDRVEVNGVSRWEGCRGRVTSQFPPSGLDLEWTPVALDGEVGVHMFRDYELTRIED